MEKNMETQINMTTKMYNEMLEKLFPPDNDSEQFGFIVTGLSKHKNGHNLLCRKFIHADESCLTNQSGVSVVPDPRFVQYVYNTVKECKGGLITVHTHPFSSENVCFSGIDDRSEEDSFPKEVNLLGKGPHASVVFGRNSVDARWYDAKTKQIEPVKAIKIIGEIGTKILTPTSQRENLDESINEIHDRQVLAFGKAGQKLIQKAKVGIVGCGGLGSILFILLVRLGVRDFVLIDDDVVENTNLNRLAGSRLIDVKNKTPKVEMLGNYGLEISDEIIIHLIAKSVFTSEAKLALKSCDYIFGGVDTQSPRVLLNSISIQHMIPYFDCGTGIQAAVDHSIEHAGGQVRTVIPGLGCLKCIKGINLDTAKMEQLPEEQRQAVIERGYIAGEDEHAPSVAPLNGVIANLAVTEFMGFVTGCKPLSRYVFYDLLRSTTVPVEFPKNPDCFSCSEDSLLGSGDSGVALPEYLISECLTNA
jgi:molybdopterin/thiamine biosynthesis adenylyltransferase